MRHEVSQREDAVLGAQEIAFLAERDTIYLATRTESGWPYIQLRGGPPGFVHALDPKTLAFADFAGNTQLITIGIAKADDRAAIIAVDYARQERIKLFVRLEIRDASAVPDLARTLTHDDYPGHVERIVVMHVAAFDWNCPQHITPRYTREEIDTATATLRSRIETLERENAALREHVRQT